MTFIFQYIKDMAGFPLTFKEFVTDPIKAILFLCLIAIMYLYIDNKLVYKAEIDRQAKRIEMLENKVDALQSRLLQINTK